MSKIYTGVVEDFDDPLKADRVRVRVFGLHTDDKNLIPTESLPWAQLMKSVESASVSGIGRSAHGLVKGSWVKVIFEDEDCQYPVVIGSVSGVSTNPGEKASLEEIAFGITQDAVVNQQEVPPPVIEETPSSENECLANVNIEGFVSKYGQGPVHQVMQACCDAGVKNPYAKIAVLSVVAKESGFKPRNESFKYSVTRLRQVFPTKTAAYTDYQLQEIVSSEESLANFLYGNRYGNAADEGYKYRGRGYIQTTFKSNYQAASTDTGVDLVSNPDKLNQGDVAAKAAAKYLIKRVGGLGTLNSYESQDAANRSVAQSVIGRNVNFNSGYGAEYFGGVTSASKLGSVVGEEPKPEPIGKVDETGQVSDGLTPTQRKLLCCSNVGFKDPTGKYPLPSQLNEPDTNRLARRNTDTNVFKSKKQHRRTGIVNIGGNFNQPEPPYNAKYPYNRGYFSESGHALEFDDTDSQERVSLFHRSGTFTEIDNYGNQVNKVIGNNYTIIEKNGYIYVDGTVRITAASDANITILGNVNMNVEGSYNLDIGGDLNVKAGGDIAFHSGGNYSTRSNSHIGLDAPRIDWNNGDSKSLGPSSRDPQNIDYPQILGESLETSEMISVDDMEYEEADQYIEKAISEGKLTKEEVEKDNSKQPEETETAAPSETVEAVPGNCGTFANASSIPAATQLSKYFTLGDLTTKVALPSERKEVKPHLGLSVAEIVCNLKKLAENSLDPVKEKYPDLIITNTFRLGTNKSQHNIGQAADMQFTTAKASDYFEIAKWIKDNVLFDQLLLEYRSNGRPWIHISYSDSPRKQVMTFMNHKKHSMGLSQLG